MWIRVRCFNIVDVPAVVWIVLAVILAAGIVFFVKRKADREKWYS